MIIKFLPSVDAERQRFGPHGPSKVHWEISASAAEFIDPASTRDSSRVVAGDLTEHDYPSARMIVPELSPFEDYEDWLDFRTGTLWGLEMAGFTVSLVPVNLKEFADWCESRSILPTISALDRFAASRDLVPADSPGRQGVV